ncbi:MULTISPECIES: GntR family transcriptional regulator [unclassified Brevibacterium]|uniref:GntR family transcriptional regulator n=1 Tax=unclassified Brevibacterium TaxID=2614124 RepID=UPI0024B515CC|nr:MULTISPECIES: GntR family transcriptional regulator [unclassified Brevibacterium]
MDRAKQPSLREHALSIIRDAIATGELAEDRIYSAAGLAKQLGISLSPVREAMMALVTEGTVEAVPNRGFRLVPITEADLEEIIRIRVLLAVPAVRQLCDRLAEAGPGSAAGEGSAGSAAGASGSGAVDLEGADGRSGGGNVPTGTGDSALAGTGDSALAGTGEAIRDQLRRLRTHAEATVAAAVAGDLVAFYTHDRRFHESLLAFGLGRRAAEISLRLRDQSRIGHLPTANAGPGGAGSSDAGPGGAEIGSAGSSGAGTDDAGPGSARSSGAGSGRAGTGAHATPGAGSRSAGTGAGVGADSSDASVRGRAVESVAVTSAKELIDIVDLIEANQPDAVADLVTRNLYFYKRTEASASDVSE